MLGDKAWECNEGVISELPNGEFSPLITGGSSPPVGLDALDVAYFQKTNSRIVLWEKVAAATTGWVKSIMGGVYRRKFITDENINIETDTVLQMHSPTIEGEFVIDGEAYIL